MERVYIEDGEAWDQAVAGLPLAHVLQSWGWGSFKSRWGWQPTRLLWRDGEHPVAAAQLLRRAIPGTPFHIGYVPKGPCLPAEEQGLADRVLDDLERETRRQRCLFVKIDPDVHASNGEFVGLLQRRGWRRSSEEVQFCNTGILDLTPSEDELLARMKGKTRYNIRLAERKGVEVRAGGAKEHATFYEMYRETAERDDFLIRPKAYYLDLWRDFQERGQAQLFIAWHEQGDPIAGLMLLTFGRTAWYFYGASTNLHRNAMPNYALQWAAIRWAKERGFARYDLWGAPYDLDDPNDSLAGVWRFKDGLGAEFRPHIGAWDYPASRVGYWALTRAIPAARRWLRPGRQSSSGPTAG